MARWSEVTSLHNPSPALPCPALPNPWLYLPIYLPIQLGSLWYFKLKLLCYELIIPACLFVNGVTTPCLKGAILIISYISANSTLIFMKFQTDAPVLQTNNPNLSIWNMGWLPHLIWIWAVSVCLCVCVCVCVYVMFFYRGNTPQYLSQMKSDLHETFRITSGGLPRWSNTSRVTSYSKFPVRNLPRPPSMT